MTDHDAGPGSRAVVVFVDRADCPWLRALKPGFRHCFAVLERDDGWIACDSLKDRIELAWLPLPGDLDLAAFYRGQGHRVLVGHPRPGGGRARFALAPHTCVTVVKRLLGVRGGRVVTPWQLYRHLSAHGFRPAGGPAPAARGRPGRPSDATILAAPRETC